MSKTINSEKGSEAPEKLRELMKGCEVMIYQDPMTETKVEGKAKLSTYIKTEGELEQWNVRFLDEKRITYPRWIKKPTW